MRRLKYHVKCSYIYQKHLRRFDESPLNLISFLRFIGNGRFRETNESSDGFDRVPSKKDERTERQILSSCR